MMDDKVERRRGRLYLEISNLLIYGFTTEQILHLSKKYGEWDVRWMLRIVCEDIAQGNQLRCAVGGKELNDPEKVIGKLLTEKS